MCQPPKFTMSGAHKQRGAALFVALVMLLVLTLIGVTIVRSSGGQIIAGVSSQLAAEALGAAEDSALAGERRVATEFNGVPTFDFDAVSNDGLYNVGGLSLNSTNWGSTFHEADGDARYTVEYLGPAPALASSISIGMGASVDQVFLFRITGRGASDKGSVRVVRTIFATAE